MTAWTHHSVSALRGMATTRSGARPRRDHGAIAHDELRRHLADGLGEAGLGTDEDRPAELRVGGQPAAGEVADRSDADGLRPVQADDDADLAGLERLLEQAGIDAVLQGVDDALLVAEVGDAIRARRGLRRRAVLGHGGESGAAVDGPVADDERDRRAARAQRHVRGQAGPVVRVVDGDALAGVQPRDGSTSRSCSRRRAPVSNAPTSAPTSSSAVPSTASGRRPAPAPDAEVDCGARPGATSRPGSAGRGAGRTDGSSGAGSRRRRSISSMVIASSLPGRRRRAPGGARRRGCRTSGRTPW